MQGTKPALHQWNKIINLVLLYLGFVEHVIYHALYTLHTTSSNGVLIFGCSTEDFLFAYSIIHLLIYFLSVINKYFSMTAKEVT